jgi:hypothetical protein
MVEALGSIVGVIIGVALAAVLGALFAGWILMLSVGAIHGWIPAVPTMGLLTSMMIAYGVIVVGRLVTADDK